MSAWSSWRPATALEARRRTPPAAASAAHALGSRKATPQRTNAELLAPLPRCLVVVMIFGPPRPRACRRVRARLQCAPRDRARGAPSTCSLQPAWLHGSSLVPYSAAVATYVYTTVLVEHLVYTVLNVLHHHAVQSLAREIGSSRSPPSSRAAASHITVSVRGRGTASARRCCDLRR